MSLKQNRARHDLQARRAGLGGVRGHCRIGVGRADLLVLAALLTFSLPLFPPRSRSGYGSAHPPRADR